MTVNGSRDLAKLAAALREAGARDLRLQMLRGIRAGGKPVIEAARRNATERLPQAGGLNTLAAAEKIRTQTRTSPRTASIRILTADRILNQTNAGFVRHPVFGDRHNWVTEATPRAQGWWDDAVNAESPKAKAEMFKVMQEVAELIALRVRL